MARRAKQFLNVQRIAELLFENRRLAQRDSMHAKQRAGPQTGNGKDLEHGSEVPQHIEPRKSAQPVRQIEPIDHVALYRTALE